MTFPFSIIFLTESSGDLQLALFVKSAMMNLSGLISVQSSSHHPHRGAVAVTRATG